MTRTTCFDVFEQCVLAVQAGELVESVSAKDKEFHFQNWFQKRLQKLDIHFESSGRNTYPDFCLVEYTEGYEVKGLAWPGRERDYDANSQVPTGYHNGRQIFYVFGRYPADLSPYQELGKGVRQYRIKKDYVLWMMSTQAAGRSLFYGMEIDNERHGKQTPLWVNPTLLATEGDLVRFHVLGIGDEFHAIHLHAHRWIEPEETKRIIDVRDIAPLEKHVFVVRAGEGVGPRDWMYHCHVFRHMEEGMSGMFRVLAKGKDDTLPPVGAVFTLSDEPGSFMKAIDRGLLEALDPREGIGFPVDFIGSHSRSLAVVRLGETVLWNMRDSVTVHTITGLIWPKGAKAGDTPFPFDRNLTIRGSTLLTDDKGRPAALTQPGLYVFVCKVHPYMFSAVIVDEDGALPLDLGNELSILTRTGGLPGNLPTTVPSLSDVPKMLLKTFFVVTDPGNWKDYTRDTWAVKFPNVPVQGSTDGTMVSTINLQDALGMTVPGIREELRNPKQPGIGEVWVNTQFELTLNKQHPVAPHLTVVASNQPVSC